MNQSKINILFTCAGRRNYLIKYFKEALNGEGKIIAADMQKTAPALIDADVAFTVPSIYNENYIDEVLKICKNNKISALISLNDLELPILSDNIEIFKKIGVEVIVPDRKVIDICFDKWKTFQFINQIGLKSPETYIDVEKVKQDIISARLKFPIILKPRWGSASIGIEIVNNLEELNLVYTLLNIKIKKSILSEASKDDVDHSILFQEFIEGDEYGIDIINNLDGDYQATIVKKKLAMRAGETDKAITVLDPEIMGIGKKIGENLKHIANLDCDIFKKGSEYFVLELNSRFGGGYPFSHMAGANVPNAIIKWLRNEAVSLNCFQVKYNEAYSKFDNLMKIHIDR